MEVICLVQTTAHSGYPSQSMDVRWLLATACADEESGGWRAGVVRAGQRGGGARGWGDGRASGGVLAGSDVQVSGLDNDDNDSGAGLRAKDEGERGMKEATRKATSRLEGQCCSWLTIRPLQGIPRFPSCHGGGS